jgi:diguanylate cyclase (GGDEF)-like protein
MNYAFLPDLSALTILVVILFLLHRRHPQQQADIWLLGLFFTLVEATAHTFYAPNVIPDKVLHVIVLDCYLLAGLIFAWASNNPRLSRRVRLLYISLNALPLLAINTTYGLNIRVARPYFPSIAAGLVIGVATSLYLRRSWAYAGLHVFGWMAAGLLVSHGDFRYVVYWSLCCVYTIAGLNFYNRLPHNSTGRVAIVTGFFIWALCFLAHPWTVMYRGYADIASHVWNMQKSLISIGMILVMLEEQVSSNEWLALHDELTGLPNRRLFGDRLANSIARSQRTNTSLVLFMLDLNGFKQINDTLGHDAGDEVLREVSKNLRDCVRAVDTVARLGGDEFMLIAADFDKDHSIDNLRELIRSAIQTPIHINGQTMIVTASMGTATYPDDGQDAAKLMKIADQRMYRLKYKPVPQISMDHDLVSSQQL